MVTTMDAKHIVIVKNITREGPGAIESLLQEKQITYEVVDLDKSEPLPTLTDQSALIVMGGPDSANDQTEKMQQELALIKQALAKNLPYFGVCLGMQTLVKAAGGNVVKSPVKEIAFRGPEDEFFTVQLTKEGRADPLFTGIPDEFRVFHLHGETVELPTEAVVLGTGKFCTNQAVKIGERAYGFQCHIELTEAMLHTWLTEDPDLLADNPKQISADFTDVKEAYSQTGRTIIANFLSIAGF